MRWSYITFSAVATMVAMTFLSSFHLTRASDGGDSLRKMAAEQGVQLREIKASLLSLQRQRNQEQPQQKPLVVDAVQSSNAHGSEASVEDLHCEWTFHPGTTLGSMPVIGWKHCAAEGARCACKGKARFGKEAKWHEKEVMEAEEIVCNSHAFGGDPNPGFLKECQCWEELEGSEGSLEQVKEACEKLGWACKGVTCPTGASTGCSVRDGVPFLAAERASGSWTKDCSSSNALPGGGLDGKHRIEGEPSIFVSMAAFRERDAHHTLRSMFAKARFPKRVFVGVVCQKYPEDPSCVPDWDCGTSHEFCIAEQVRERIFPANKTKGPTFARAIAASMYRGEDFFMMIDAHNRFVQDWDMKLLGDIRNCPSKKCVLSCYPQGLNISDPEKPHPLGTPPGTPLESFGSVSHLCQGEFHNQAVIKNHRAQTVSMSTHPRPQPYTGAGLVFGPGRMVIECPFDPFLPFLWDGEEFLYTARLWTWGYDFFSPSENILFHHYYRDNQPRVWGERSWSSGTGTAEQATAYKRLQLIIGAPKVNSDIPMVDPKIEDSAVTRQLPRYGLGPRRTMAEYWKFARIDIRSREGDPLKGNHKGYFCKKFGHPQGPYEVPPP